MIQKLINKVKEIFSFYRDKYYSKIEYKNYDVDSFHQDSLENSLIDRGDKIEKICEDIEKKDFSGEENTKVELKKTGKKKIIYPLSKLLIGDIVWANRYESDEEREQILKGHEIGPYIIIGFEKDEPIGVYATSRNKKEFLLLGKIIGEKNTYINVSKMKKITEENYRGKVPCTLSNDNLLKIKKKIYGEGNSDYFSTEDISYGVGDILKSKHGYYFIIDILEGKYIYSKIDSYSFYLNQIDFGRYKFNLISSALKGRYVNTISSEQLKVIKAQYKEYLTLEKAKMTNQLDVGYVVLYRSSYYYVSSICRDQYTLVLLQEASKHDTDTIGMEDLYFHPVFDYTIEINKRNHYSIFAVTEDKTREKFKELKLNYKRNLKLEKQELIKRKKQLEELNLLKNTYSVGSIIENEAYFKVRFLVVGYNEEELITINLDQYEEKQMIKYYTFNIKDKSNQFIETYNHMDFISSKVKSLTLKQ